MVAVLEIKMNRRMRRLRIIDRSFTKKGYAFGHKIGGKTLALAEHYYKKAKEQNL